MIVTYPDENLTYATLLEGTEILNIHTGEHAAIDVLADGARQGVGAVNPMLTSGPDKGASLVMSPTEVITHWRKVNTRR